LIDGGKGQLKAATRARDETGLSIPMIGLAKREEEIIVKKLTAPQNRHFQGPALETALENTLQDKARAMGGYVAESTEFISILLPGNSHIVKLLQRIRDESHRFAVSYHSTLKRQRNSSSLLDEVPGIGPATRKKLIRHFGSARAVINAEPAELKKLLGQQTGASIVKYLMALK